MRRKGTDVRKPNSDHRVRGRARSARTEAASPELPAALARAREREDREKRHERDMKEREDREKQTHKQPLQIVYKNCIGRKNT